MIDKDKDRAAVKGREVGLLLYVFTIISLLISIIALYYSDVNGYLTWVAFTIVLLMLSVACAAWPETFGAFIWHIMTSPQP